MRNWDVLAWRHDLEQRWGVTDELDEELGILGAPEDEPSSAFLDGVGAALKDAWTATVQGMEQAEV